MRGTHERENSAPHARPGVENAGRKTGPIREPLKDQAGTSDVRSAVGRVEKFGGKASAGKQAGVAAGTDRHAKGYRQPKQITRCIG